MSRSQRQKLKDGPTMKDWEEGPRQIIVSLLSRESTDSSPVQTYASFMNNYQLVFQLSLSKHGEDVYADIMALFTDHLDQLSSKLSTTSNEALPMAFISGWRVYTNALKQTSTMCDYLLRHHLRHNQRRPPPLSQVLDDIFVTRVLFSEAQPTECRLRDVLASASTSENTGAEGEGATERVDGQDERERVMVVLKELERRDKSGRVAGAFPDLGI